MGWLVLLLIISFVELCKWIGRVEVCSAVSVVGVASSHYCCDHLAPSTNPLFTPTILSVFDILLLICEYATFYPYNVLLKIVQILKLSRKPLMQKLNFG